MRRSATAAAILLLVVGGLLAACGVEVPDDVAADIEADRRTTSTSGVAATTVPPTSDDALEQTLIDNGYTLAEARCGAQNLRERLSEAEIAEIVAADTVEEIEPGLAEAFADALQPCVEDGAGAATPTDGAGGDDDGDGSSEPGGPDVPDRSGD